MSLPLSWYMLSFGMFICLIICISLSIIQRKSFQWYSKFMDDANFFQGKRELICLYGVYIAGSICCLQCLLNHISSFLPHWFCHYGMGICVIFHEAAKTLGYGYFLERANSMTKLTSIQVLSTVVQKYILPIYISSYFLMYSIICPLKFRGLSMDPTTSSSPTSCLFEQYEVWVFYLSVVVEVLNSIFFVWLFGYPLYKIIDPKEHIELVRIIRFNVIFSSICCVSSVTFLFYRAFARSGTLAYYLWIAGNVDLVFNSLAIFAMCSVNRSYMSFICCGNDASKSKSSTHVYVDVTTEVTGVNKSLMKSYIASSVQRNTVVTAQPDVERKDQDYTTTKTEFQTITLFPEFNKGVDLESTKL